MTACWRHFAVTVVLVAFAQPAAAQVFVSGGAFSNILRFGKYSSESPTVYEEDLSGTSTGIVASVGGIFAKHGVVAVEVARPKEIHTDFEPYRYLYPVPPQQYVTLRSVDRRSTNVSIVGGYRSSEWNRLTATVLGGIMFVEERVHQVQTFQPPLPPPSPSLPSITTIRRELLAPVFGVDVDVAVIPHLSLVPQVRLYRMSSMQGYGVVGIWPGVSARWRF